ncbi:sensor histidine kinase [Scatolibacter rhodanostii]|uniref:sensor histidine kinase n=1 Tax=Scatolibacter rhodanostii TaxID=2014781 RepID=UPI000C08AD3E|nr:sensor histidine kinase [Scatolibacter rhodanostii]
MEKTRFKTAAWFYLKEKYRYFLLLLTFIFIYALVFCLAHVDIDVILYAGLICLFVGVIVIVVDFIHFYHMNQQLGELKKTITVDLSGLPESKKWTELHYQELIRILSDNKNKAETNARKKENEMVDYYTMWAHQIKTPIAATKLLLQSEQNSQKAELLSELFRIEQYVEMVLSYLRLEGPNDFLLKQYPLEDIVKQVVRKYAPLFIRQKIKLDLKPIEGTVLTDEKWLAFVLEQLLSNALKYTQKGTVSIYLSSPGHLVMEDTGMGISPEDLPRIGEKGFTGYNGREQKQATGLGLYLCKKIMKRLSHSMSFESEIGKGTRVILNLDTISFFVE